MSDVITELANEANDKTMQIARLKAENAKLREQSERLRTQLADVTKSVGRVEERCAKTFEVGKRWMAKAARFEAENAKLRELVEDMLDCIQIRAAFSRPPTEEMYEMFYKRARELEVEP